MSFFIPDKIIKRGKKFVINMRTLGISLCLAILLTSCKKEKCSVDPEIAKIPVDVDVVRIDQEMFQLNSVAEAMAFLDKYPEFSENFLERSQYPHDSILAGKIIALTNDPHIDTLYRETQEIFGDMSDLKAEFEMAFRHIKHYYPDFKIPKIYAAITGFGSDLFVSPAMIAIGLDFFLGEGATYRPVDFPAYILRRYRKEYIAPSAILLLSDRFNKTDHENKTMLADMVHYGKAYYFTKQMMPCAPDSLLIGYTAQEITDARDNADIIWANFIHNELLFETSHIMKNKFLGERPKTIEIGNRCPGRIGVWVGWEIVKKYMEKTGESLQSLMENTDAQQIFSKSKYRGK